jgi:HD superfamily phosphodiesterase
MSVTYKKCLAHTLFAALAFTATGMPVQAAEAAKPAIEHGADWRTAVQTFVKANMKHPAWGYSHSERDYVLAKELAAADGVTLDDDVLFAASYLHDVAAFAPFRTSADHQDVAADLVPSLLEGTGFPMAKIEAVRGAIRTHMYARDPKGPEAIYLHDADALDWLGAIGIARIFGIVDPAGGSPDGPAAVKRLEDSLENVPPRIVSKAGKARIEQRARELKDFLSALRAETADIRRL